MDNTDIFISSKSKAPISTNDVKAYNKETLSDKIRKLTTNVQLITNKMKTKITKINLEADKTQLLDKKNSLIVKKKEFRIEIAVLNATGSSNAPIRNY